MPLVAVSARTGAGLDDLLDMVLLVADLGDYKADAMRKAVGTVIEARRDKNWRPGGAHKDPRQKYKDAKKDKWQRFKKNIRSRWESKGGKKKNEE